MLAARTVPGHDRPRRRLGRADRVEQQLDAVAKARRVRVLADGHRPDDRPTPTTGRRADLRLGIAGRHLPRTFHAWFAEPLPRSAFPIEDRAAQWSTLAQDHRDHRRARRERSPTTDFDAARDRADSPPTPDRGRPSAARPSPRSSTRCS